MLIYFRAPIHFSLMSLEFRESPQSPTYLKEKPDNSQVFLDVAPTGIEPISNV